MLGTVVKLRFHHPWFVLLAMWASLVLFAYALYLQIALAQFDQNVDAETLRHAFEVLLGGISLFVFSVILIFARRPQEGKAWIQLTASLPYTLEKQDEVAWIEERWTRTGQLVAAVGFQAFFWGAFVIIGFPIPLAIVQLVPQGMWLVLIALFPTGISETRKKKLLETSVWWIQQLRAVQIVVMYGSFVMLWQFLLRLTELTGEAIRPGGPGAAFAELASFSPLRLFVNLSWFPFGVTTQSITPREYFVLATNGYSIWEETSLLGFACLGLAWMVAAIALIAWAALQDYRAFYQESTVTEKHTITRLSPPTSRTFRCLLASLFIAMLV